MSDITDKKYCICISTSILFEDIFHDLKKVLAKLGFADANLYR